MVYLIGFDMATYKKVYKDGKHVATITTNKPGKKGYTIIPKRTKKDRQKYATSMFIKGTGGYKKLKAFADSIKKSGGGLLSTGEIVTTLDPGNKNIIEAKGIAYDAKTNLPSKNTFRDDFTNLVKPLKVTRSYTTPKALRTNVAYRGDGTANKPVRMSNVVSLEKFVRDNMATATRTMAEGPKKKLKMFPNRSRVSGSAIYDSAGMSKQDREFLKKLQEMYGK